MAVRPTTPDNNPTLEQQLELAERTAQVRESWDASTEYKRRVYRTGRYNFPVMSTSDFVQGNFDMR